MYKYNPFTGKLDLVSNSTIADDYIVYVSSMADLPAVVLGEIFINTGRLYYFLRVVDLGGAILRIGSCAIQGISQELAGIENAEVIVNDTATLSSILFRSCTIEIDAPLGAYDWQHINFYDCNSIEIKQADNLVLDTIGFINTYNVVISGTINSFILAPNCIFRSILEPTATFLKIASTAVITRRIRIQDSVFQTSFVTQNSIVFEAGASIGIESFIVKTVRFTGPGTAVTGINGDNDKAFFFEAIGTGVINSTAIANMYMKNNLVPTLVTVIGDRYPMLGITQFGPIYQKFIHNLSENSLVYSSIVQRIFTVRVTYTVLSGSNNVVGVYIGIARSGFPIDPTANRISESEMYTTTNGARPENSVVQCIVTLNQGDRIYCIVQNTTAATNITISFFNMIVEKAGA